MTRHYGGKPRCRPEGEWLRLSGDFTEIAEEFSGRNDLVVKISPDAGYDDDAYENGRLKKDAEQQHAIFFRNLGIIEINGGHMPEGLDLGEVWPLERGSRKDYPVIWGLLAHEASHARHTLWPEGLPDEVTGEEMHWIGAAKILEEPRIEYRQLDFRPQDQVWLQASATEITLSEIREALEKDTGRAAVARMAALTLGRVDAGSIDSMDATDRLEKLARETFGDDYQEMRQIWTEALETADDDTGAMLGLGRRWFELTGDDGMDGGAAASLGEAAAAIMNALSELAQHARGEANGENAANRRLAKLKKAEKDRRKENTRQKEARGQATAVFHANPDENSALRTSPVIGYRDPTSTETALARRTRSALQNAQVPERAVTRTASALPPGRLSVRSQMQARMLRAQGIPVTAEPYRRKSRRRVQVPPLKVSIIQDVSGSQGNAAAAAVSGAWSLAYATQGMTDAQVAMVLFGDTVHSVISPRQKLPRVPVLRTPGSSHRLHEALLAMEGELDLMRGGFARLLVILTDGEHEDSQIRMRDPALKRLADAGVRILWFATDGYSGHPKVPQIRHPNLRVYEKASGRYDIIPQVICAEAVNALKQ